MNKSADISIQRENVILNNIKRDPCIFSEYVRGIRFNPSTFIKTDSCNEAFQIVNNEANGMVAVADVFEAVNCVLQVSALQ